MDTPPRTSQLIETTPETAIIDFPIPIPAPMLVNASVRGQLSYRQTVSHLTNSTHLPVDERALSNTDGHSSVSVTGPWWLTTNGRYHPADWSRHERGSCLAFVAFGSRPLNLVGYQIFGIGLEHTQSVMIDLL